MATAKPKAKKAAPATGFKRGQRVKVVREGSFAYGSSGTVERSEAGKVYVKLANKQAATAFPPGALKAA
jgi:transcription antitermination factor NusG